MPLEVLLNHILFCGFFISLLLSLLIKFINASCLSVDLSYFVISLINVIGSGHIATFIFLSIELTYSIGIKLLFFNKNLSFDLIIST